jgi:hypothetical protein
MKPVGLCVVFASLLVAAVGAARGRADGLPVLGVDVGGVGVATADVRYVTIPAGRSTVVARVRSAGGEVVASRLLPGTFTIPAVAYDGSASGLSANGRTLALIEPRVSFPRAVTRLLILDTRQLRPLRLVRLRGDFSFDAISPRGSLMYLIEYLSPTDPTRYLVRAFDLRAERLLNKPVVDPREPGEKMRGIPLSRVTSADGRWAYTLYDGAGKTPFIHALDTSTRTARCIDLDALTGGDLSRLRLRLDGRGTALTIARTGRPLAEVDTRSFQLTVLSASETDASAQETSRIPSTLVGLAVAGGLTGAATLAFTLLRRRRRRRLVTVR